MTYPLDKSLLIVCEFRFYYTIQLYKSAACEPNLLDFKEPSAMQRESTEASKRKF